MQTKEIAREQIMAEIIAERGAMILEQHNTITELKAKIKSLETVSAPKEEEKGD